ncbi:SDR family NAD(P)-dependent oxidoreductase [Streptomyces parvulus]|uniref:SDR family NAD(P)-dependent oxidoreductase n=1 Tax=Streptomyces parvulus TaxID=146923 RepID=UPI002852EC80|nr:SDR family NAD(P)-dependent oxidoreductase [Streptomyces parvulus]
MVCVSSARYSRRRFQLPDRRRAMSHEQNDGGPAGPVVVVIGGSSGMGFETARRVRAEGGQVFLTGRNAERLERAAAQIQPLGTATFDAADPEGSGRSSRICRTPSITSSPPPAARRTCPWPRWISLRPAVTSATAWP